MWLKLSISWAGHGQVLGNSGAPELWDFVEDVIEGHEHEYVLFLYSALSTWDPAWRVSWNKVLE